ncbi:MAG TPA: class I SAM-dependent rRNA methyltransferase [Microthrixaceae bacterium]|nr:class I SAM-dependent rRNA methyltransferase [Microthrixaceae bacterium]
MSPAQDVDAPPVRRLAVRVTKDAVRQIKGGHPWVFDKSVTSVKPEGVAGDLAVVFDDRRQFIAVGLYDPDSPIRIKILHHGKPKTIDAEFWHERLSAARDIRLAAFDTSRTNGYREVHGENDGLPSLILDRYDDVHVLKLYSEAWLPHLDGLIPAIETVFEPRSLVLRLSRGMKQSARHAGPNSRKPVTAAGDGSTLIGDVPDGLVRFVENGLRFEADVIRGQKTGHFLDQRDNRARVRRLAQGLKVLDVYSCSGGFSVNAAAGAARLVHSVDISEAAIASAKRNMSLNASRPAVRACSHQVAVGDAMTVMSQMIDAGRTFDMVVVDPPSFASKQSQVEGALRAYGRLTELACRLLEPGGRLVQASCSARVTADEFHVGVVESAYRAGFVLADISETGHGVDHPIGFAQGGYLKATFATVHSAR